MPTTMLHFRKETTNLNDFPAKEMPLDVLCNDSHHFQSWHQWTTMTTWTSCSASTSVRIMLRKANCVGECRMLQGSRVEAPCPMHRMSMVFSVLHGCVGLRSATTTSCAITLRRGSPMRTNRIVFSESKSSHTYFSQNASEVIDPPKLPNFWHTKNISWTSQHDAKTFQDLALRAHVLNAKVMCLACSWLHMKQWHIVM